MNARQKADAKILINKHQDTGMMKRLAHRTTKYGTKVTLTANANVWKEEGKHIIVAEFEVRIVTTDGEYIEQQYSTLEKAVRRYVEER